MNRFKIILFPVMVLLVFISGCGKNKTDYYENSSHIPLNIYVYSDESGFIVEYDCKKCNEYESVCFDHIESNEMFLSLIGTDSLISFYSAIDESDQEKDEMKEKEVISVLKKIDNPKTVVELSDFKIRRDSITKLNFDSLVLSHCDLSDMDGSNVKKIEFRGCYGIPWKDYAPDSFLQLDTLVLLLSNNEYPDTMESFLTIDSLKKLVFVLNPVSANGLVPDNLLNGLVLSKENREGLNEIVCLMPYDFEQISDFLDSCDCEVIIDFYRGSAVLNIENW